MTVTLARKMVTRMRFEPGSQVHIQCERGKLIITKES